MQPPPSGGRQQSSALLHLVAQFHHTCHADAQLF